MNAKFLCAVGACFGVAGAASAQLTASAANGAAGTPFVGPAGTEVYNNEYTGASTAGSAAQIFEAAFAAYDIWACDDFGTDVGYDTLELSSVGFCASGCVDPFLVQDFFGRIYDGMPNEGASIVAESTDFDFNGIDTWTAQFGDQCLPAGDYIFAFAARNDFGTNGQTYFFQEMGQGDDAFQWNPGGAFGFPDNIQFLEDFFNPGVPTAVNAVITGTQNDDCGGGGCYADCNGDEQLSILDFVCFQESFQAGESYSDCNGDDQHSILDFVCFQEEFQAGCP